MGLKNKLNKMKSFLFDEEEEKEIKPVKKTIRKEKELEEVFTPVETESKNDLYFEDISDNSFEKTEEIKSRSVKKEKEFSFPEFDDDDFMVTTKKPESLIKPEKKEEVKVPLYQGRRKEEPKKFKPTPIISPIYGLLDEEGNTIKDNANDSSSSYNDDITIDEVRKKAYGTLDDTLEHTIKNLSSKTIEEAEKEMEEKELSRQKAKQEKKKEEAKIISQEEDDYDDDDDMILPNVSFKEIDVDKETKKVSKKKVEVKDDDDDDDTKEQDLFNLIDTMYQKEGDED